MQNDPGRSYKCTFTSIRHDKIYSVKVSLLILAPK